MKERSLIDRAETRVLTLADETRYAENGIVSRTLLDTGMARVVLFGFKAGQSLSEHLTTRHALVQILSGRCEFNLDGVWHTLETGSLVHMPPHLRHAVRASEDFSMLLTLVHAETLPQASSSRPAAEAARSREAAPRG
jgi:quercetin dioxygenase-like cupin family protein